jgi:bifunctional non-homologous end joining protein LigD
MLPKVPELAEIHKNVNVRCILDGELAVIKDGRPDFFEIQKRSMMSNPVKIDMAAKKYPACFTAFDILYYENRQVTDLPLTERKELLQKAVISENGRFAVSRFIEKNGIQFYALAEQQELEGIVAKRKDSKYYFDKRTKDWIKIKYLQDDDFVVLGYVPKENSMNSIILGQYSNGQLVYKGHVTLGVGGEPFRRIKTLNKTDCPFSEIPKGNENAVWVTPELVCTVKYMMKTESGGMRQPVFKGLREDKSPEECIDNIT